MTAVEHQAQAEQVVIDRALANGDECFMGYGDTSAVLRLTERGVGHWEQRCPFVATFVLHEGRPS